MHRCIRGSKGLIKVVEVFGVNNLYAARLSGTPRPGNPRSLPLIPHSFLFIQRRLGVKRTLSRLSLLVYARAHPRPCNNPMTDLVNVSWRFRFCFRMHRSWIGCQTTMTMKSIRAMLRAISNNYSETVKGNANEGSRLSGRVRRAAQLFVGNILIRLGLRGQSNDGRRDGEGLVGLSGSETIIEGGAAGRGQVRREGRSRSGSPRIKSGGSDEFSDEGFFLSNGSADPILQIKIPRIPIRPICLIIPDPSTQTTLPSNSNQFALWRNAI